MPFDLDRAIKDAEKAGYVQGGDRFKIKEGANRIRIVAEPVPHQGSYEGRPNFKWLTYVIDRTDRQVKLFFMPHTICKVIRDLQKSDDYSFFDFPMPYDVTINAKHAGTKEVEYSVVAARQNTELTPTEEQAITKKKPLSEVHKALKEKEGTPQTADESPPTPPFDPDEPPF